MMEMLGMRGTRTDGEFRQPVPYNLLLTRNWMLLVPRVKGHYKTLPIDGLAFAGSIFVANATQLAVLRERGPMGALSDVARVRL
jgi:ATP adenylyltransferase